MRVLRRSLLRPTALCLLAGLGLASAASAGPREQAKRIHDRLVGTPPAPAMLASMEALVASDDALGAAMLAMQNPVFYSSALKDFFTPFTNVEQTVIHHRFGLGAKPGTPPLTLEQVGQIIGVTKERVRQIQNKALEKVRLFLEETTEGVVEQTDDEAPPLSAN